MNPLRPLAGSCCPVILMVPLFTLCSHPPPPMPLRYTGYCTNPGSQWALEHARFTTPPTHTHAQTHTLSPFPTANTSALGLGPVAAPALSLSQRPVSLHFLPGPPSSTNQRCFALGQARCAPKWVCIAPTPLNTCPCCVGKYAGLQGGAAPNSQPTSAARALATGHPQMLCWVAAWQWPSGLQEPPASCSPGPCTPHSRPQCARPRRMTSGCTCGVCLPQHTTGWTSSHEGGALACRCTAAVPPCLGG